ncbi:splicing factor 3a subunit 2 [Dermatophagoides farinae]|uniref:splicing factor 3a subunit 2 n=1 Tax=Dermatophagoides farinae TaxID=6954 RepID=UPI003F6192A3
MDFQHRPGAKTGGGGVASWSETNRDRRERLRQLALETIDLAKDPYFMKNHLGSYECKLCLTLHNNEGSYLAHTQGKKHQSNLARRAAKDAKDAPQPMLSKSRIDIRKFVKIGRPGYRVTKQFDQENQQQSLLFQIDYPEISENIAPRHRFMSAYEQKIEPPDRHWQYLLFAAEPYETIGFKIPSREVDKAEGKFWTLWNRESKQFFLQFAFKVESKGSSLIHQNNILPSSSSSTSTSSTTTSTATIKSTVAGNQSSNNTTIESPSTTTSAASAAASAAGEIPKNNNDNQNGD